MTTNYESQIEMNLSETMNNKNKYKNKTGYDFKLMKMNNKTYDLRRQVMGMVYEAKKIVPDLPRVEIRIVEKHEEKRIGGYAWLGQNVVHIKKDVIKDFAQDPTFLQWLVFHELVHAVFGFGHDKKCRLMSAVYQGPNSKPELNKLFKKYAEKSTQKK